MNDHELIAKLLIGDQQATRLFYQNYKAKLLGFISRKIGSELDAEELAQDTLIAALENLPLFNAHSSLYSWICSIAKHEIADFYRKQKIKKVLYTTLPFLEKLADEALSPDLELEKEELKTKFYHTLANLPEGFERILRLRYIDRLTLSEIAREVGLSYKATESRLFRARLAFQKRFVQSYPEYQKTGQVFRSLLTS
jgi:RNA polymerase sigma-70 factor (ECF subfamily)